MGRKDLRDGVDELRVRERKGNAGPRLPEGELDDIGTVIKPSDQHKRCPGLIIEGKVSVEHSPVSQGARKSEKDVCRGPGRLWLRQGSKGISADEVLAETKGLGR